MCQICCELESVIIPATETRRVVLACSTMYGIWKNKLPASTEHFDMDSIVGGTVKDMMRALVKNYLYFGQGFGPVWTSEDPPVLSGSVIGQFCTVCYIFTQISDFH